MPPKRRKASEPVSAPEPKKRVTRSSTKSDPPVAQNIKDEPSIVEPESSRAERKTKTKKASSTTTNSNTAKTRTKEDAAEDSSILEPTSEPHGVTSLTITSDLVKKPIECHHYAPANAVDHKPSTLIFTHGAGGTLSAPAVVDFCTGFSTSLPIIAFQGSMNLKARTKGFHACIDYLRGESAESKAKNRDKDIDNTLLLGGRSMGARAAVIAANEVMQEEGSAFRLILVSYPLKGPKDDIRDEILLELSKAVQVLFIIGDKDTMCPLDLLNETRSKMTAGSQIIVVRGADHGMHVKPAKKEKDVGEETGRLAAEWVHGRMNEDVTHIGEDE